MEKNIKKILLIFLLLVSSCTRYFVKPTHTSFFKEIETTYDIRYDELENIYILDYETPVLHADGTTSYDGAIFNPIVVYNNNTFNFYFNVIHAYTGSNTEEQIFTLYYKSNGKFHNIPLIYDQYLSSEISSGNFYHTSYAYKVFYAMNSVQSAHIYKKLSQISVEEIRIRGNDMEFILNDESLFKFTESLKFYKDVANSEYSINTTVSNIKNNGQQYHKRAEKSVDTINILNSLF